MTASFHRLEMQEEKRRENSFVEHEIRGLIQRAAERFAQARGLKKASVSKDDITEFFRDELRVEPASEAEKCLVYEFCATRKFGESSGVENPSVKDDGKLQDDIQERVEFVEETETSKSSYMGQIVGGHLKILEARIDTDYKFRIYSSPPMKKGLAILSDPLAVGAIYGAVVGGGLGLISLGRIGVTAGVLIGLSAGVVCGFGFRQHMKEDHITGYDIFSHFGEDDSQLWRVEGRCICRKFMYTYQHFEEAVTLEKTGNHW